MTGNPLYSLTATAGLAQELERTQGLSSVLASLWATPYGSTRCRSCSAAIVGVPLAIWMAPRRVLVPSALLVLLFVVYVAEGAAGRR